MAKSGNYAQVIKWSTYAIYSGHKWGIPPSVLLGLIDVESGGNPGETSSAGAQGITQFIPGTAAKYHVNVAPGQEVSQVEGAAHYLHDLGYAKNPTAALEGYNTGTIGSSVAAGYAATVLSRAGSYKAFDSASADKLTGAQKKKILTGPQSGPDEIPGLDTTPLGNLSSGLSGVGDLITVAVKLLGDLLDPTFWLHALEVVGGAVILYFGLREVARTGKDMA
jgi:Transglycosylase SLT domain